jgi:hypothetical protein
MTHSHYTSLPKADRLSAQKLAKELLQSIPAAEEPLEFDTPAQALYTAFVKAEKLIAVLIYRDGKNEGWCGDLVFPKLKGVTQIRVTGALPLKSYQAALERVSGMIAAIKATKEHPIVAKIRDRGFDPQDTVLFEVQYGNGYGWLFLSETQIPTLAKSFSNHVIPLRGNSLANRIECARMIVLDLTP